MSFSFGMFLTTSTRHMPQPNSSIRLRRELTPQGPHTSQTQCPIKTSNQIRPPLTLPKLVSWATWLSNCTNY